ncbi:hypothetical protein OCH239_16975 [Roseivivax halodurans JCM 10272]|uniref:histidine kinase n=2 Tax=Roseivivax halodurans TaxID=93683 RepID=X7EAD7_9RHOB|nr:hypothetical protein OCH239_16975 [Roseivivax halodurans JCM 10272]
MEAESLLEAKSRELFDANEELRAQAARLEEAVQERTADLERAKLEAEAANEAKSAFLAMISHDIRTPLNGVLGMASALAETPLTAEQSEMVHLLHSSGQTLLGLLSDILDLTRIEARRMDLELVPVDIPRLARDLHGLFAIEAASKGLAFTLTVGEGCAGPVMTDPTRLRQILTNLVQNAVKFTEAGQVALCVARSDARLTFTVSDTGIGVPEDRRSRLFEAFSQIDSSVARRFGGSGLGLAIARELCRLLGGDLTFAPRPGGGSRFTAIILAPAAEPDAAATSGRGIRDDPDRVLAGRKWRILVAEDNAINQKVLSLMLRRFDLQLTFVETGTEAVAACRSTTFDLVLMDVNMPGMDGTEAAMEIRRIETERDLPRVPIIAVSANAMTHQVKAYLAAGIDTHVPKPLRREALVATMARLLDRAHVGT